MFKKTLALAAAMIVSASTAFAVTVTPFATPLSAGDNTLGYAQATVSEDFGMTVLSLTAADNLVAQISATVNPFFFDLSGNPSNSIDLAYSINGGAMTSIAITTVDVGVGFIGAAGITLDLVAGDVASLFISGTAGQSGNQVTFAVETAPAAVPVAPAGVLLITALGALGLRRRAA